MSDDPKSIARYPRNIVSSVSISSCVKQKLCEVEWEHIIYRADKMTGDDGEMSHTHCNNQA